MARVLITGVAGFIGFHLARKLQPTNEVFGLDFGYQNENTLNGIRLKYLGNQIKFIETDIRNRKKLSNTIKKVKPDIVIHLAGCTGIATSKTNPDLYFDTNVTGFYNLLTVCRELNLTKVIYASSSSVYNESEKSIGKESDILENQKSFYGTTKRTDELIASNFAYQFEMQLIGLRFFTVYGSWVRSDMAAWKFMNALLNNHQIVLFNNGKVYRDFTHVSDIVKAIELLITKTLSFPSENGHQLFNIGSGFPVSVYDYLSLIAKNIGKNPNFISMPLPENELSFTHSDTSKLFKFINFKPQCSLESGVFEMTEWFLKSQELLKPIR
jgi:UDP-glucuronate 4-epimerase